MRYLIAKGEKKQCSFYSSKDVVKRFHEMYPNCLTLFLNRALKRAIEDKRLFDVIFFGDLTN